MLTWKNIKGGNETTGELELVWEVHGDPISDDYTFEDASADDLLRLWVERYYPEPVSEELYGPGALKIHWFIGGMTFEGAPFQADVYELDDDEDDFLDFYTWPVHEGTSCCGARRC